MQESHRKSERRREGDEMLHLQLLDLALLSQARGRRDCAEITPRLRRGCAEVAPRARSRAEADEPRLAADSQPRVRSQADLLAGVFASTFVKMALQLGAASECTTLTASRAHAQDTPTTCPRHVHRYVTLDTFPWCPLLRCYWGWRDLCHNCEVGDAAPA